MRRQGSRMDRDRWHFIIFDVRGRNTRSQQILFHGLAGNTEHWRDPGCVVLHPNSAKSQQHKLGWVSRLDWRHVELIVYSMY